MNQAGRKSRDLAVYLLFLAISLSIYSRAFDNGFRQDDHVFLRHVETTSFAESLRPSADFTFYRPGTLILFRLVYGVFGRNSGAFIAFNFVLHVTISLLALLLLRKMFSSRGLAALGAGLFLVGFGHYGKVVMWSCCCGQLASAMLSVAGILASLSWAESRGSPGSRRFLAAAILLMTSAGLFHESAIVTPAVAVVAVLAVRRQGGLPGKGQYRPADASGPAAFRDGPDTLLGPPGLPARRGKAPSGPSISRTLCGVRDSPSAEDGNCTGLSAAGKIVEVRACPASGRGVGPACGNGLSRSFQEERPEGARHLVPAGDPAVHAHRPS